MKQVVSEKLRGSGYIEVNCNKNEKWILQKRKFSNKRRATCVSIVLIFPRDSKIYEFPSTLTRVCKLYARLQVYLLKLVLGIES